MLQTLDPHSSFMDPRTYAQMRERQEGRYYGLGLTIHPSTATSPRCACSKARRRSATAFAAAT
jgi:C-terminal processing protease CtpA/Prc